MKYEIALEQNKFGVQYRTLKKNFKIPCISHCLGVILYSSLKQIFLKKIISAYIIMLVQNGPFAPTGTSFRNFIHNTIV